MKRLYNDNTKKEENVITVLITDGSGKSANVYVEKISEDDLIKAKYYEMAIVPNPNTVPNHQKIEIQDGVIVNNLYTRDRILVDLLIEELRTKLKKQLKAKSKKEETRGILVEGIDIDTSEDAQSKLSNGAFFSSKVPDRDLSFPDKNGKWKKVTNAQLNDIFKAVGNHKADVYDNEMLHDGLLDEADLATLQAYDINIGW